MCQCAVPALTEKSNLLNTDFKIELHLFHFVIQRINSKIVAFFGFTCFKSVAGNLQGLNFKKIQTFKEKNFKKSKQIVSTTGEELLSSFHVNSLTLSLSIKGVSNNSSAQIKSLTVCSFMF